MMIIDRCSCMQIYDRFNPSTWKISFSVPFSLDFWPCWPLNPPHCPRRTAAASPVELFSFSWGSFWWGRWRGSPPLLPRRPCRRCPRPFLRLISEDSEVQVWASQGHHPRHPLWLTRRRSRRQWQWRSPWPRPRFPQALWQGFTFKPWEEYQKLQFAKFNLVDLTTSSM